MNKQSKKEREVEEVFEMPKWMDCSWRRIPCGEDKCPICGRIKKDRQRHIEKGENPDTTESALEDISRNFKEVMEVIREDAKKHGFDIETQDVEEIKEPPRPNEFPIYNKLKNWHHDIYKIADESDATNSTWLFNEAAEDLLWYANTILAKTYRQLCNAWQIERGEEYGDEDHKYTGYVISECLSILKNSLLVLSRMEVEQKLKLNLALVYLTSIEKDILDI